MTLFLHYNLYILLIRNKKHYLSFLEVSLEGNYVLKSRSADITAVTTYEGFKNGIEMITERNDRTQLSVMASYDIESGLVDSSVSVVTNYMGGTGKQYVAPAIPFVQQGTENIFGTVELTVSAEEYVLLKIYNVLFLES